MKLYHDVCPVSGPPGSHPPVPALSVSPTLSLESRVLASSVWVSSCTSASAHGLEEPSRERVVFVGPPPSFGWRRTEPLLLLPPRRGSC